MKHTILIALLVMTNAAYSQLEHNEISKTIIALETSALEKWNKGDPGGYLDISADDVVYFDPYTEQRLDGLKSLRKYYDPIKGQVRVSKYDFLNPKVQASGEMAVLTFNLISYEGEEIYKWNCTEVYRLEKETWRIIQTHWSFTKPNLKL
jgi:ketosteroid isomerase-like protein